MIKDLFSTSILAGIRDKIALKCTSFCNYAQGVCSKSIINRFYNKCAILLNNAFTSSFFAKITDPASRNRFILQDCSYIRWISEACKHAARNLSNSDSTKKLANYLNILRLASIREWGFIFIVAVSTNSIFFLISQRAMGPAVIVLNFLLLLTAFTAIYSGSSWDSIKATSSSLKVFNKYCKKNN